MSGSIGQDIVTPGAGGITVADSATALIYGLAGVTILTIQPLVFGPLVGAGILTESGLALLAASEMALLALTSAMLPGWLSNGHLRTKMVGLALLMVGANFLSVSVMETDLLLPVRAVCGFAEGGILAGAATILLSAENPERMNALFLAVSNSVTAVIAFLVPTWLLVNYGLTASFYLMAAIGIVGLLAVLPLRFVPGPMEMPGRNWRIWPAATFAVLAGVVFQNAAVMAGWTFLESTARREGFDPGVLGLSASLGVLAQVAGAACVAMFAFRLPAGRALILASLAISASVFWLGHPGAPLSFIAANVVMGFFWLASLPMSIKIMLEIERRREAIYLVAAAQMIGMSLGPLIASAFVSEGQVRPAYWVALCLGLVAAGLFLIAKQSPDRIKTTHTKA
ncbi:hypothetical protein GCM10023208_04770 [Erythrobacter westpacificensis]|uniref:MFS transporter n=1 Tax=Erythrobacter westpacificensis TaxID=1055231 RepID=A0ABP9K314_9SPHN